MFPLKIDMSLYDFGFQVVHLIILLEGQVDYQYDPLTCLGLEVMALP